jgi:hypothetical protein
MDGGLEEGAACIPDCAVKDAPVVRSPSRQCLVWNSQTLMLLFWDLEAVSVLFAVHVLVVLKLV